MALQYIYLTTKANTPARALTIAEVDKNFTDIQGAVNGIGGLDDVTGQWTLGGAVNCVTPSTSLQVANKAYVDNQINRYIGIATALS
jgi:hypothetical protein